MPLPAGFILIAVRTYCESFAILRHRGRLRRKDCKYGFVGGGHGLFYAYHRYTKARALCFTPFNPGAPGACFGAEAGSV